MAEANRKLILKDGREYNIAAEEGKYWICDGTQFRKNSSRILKVVEETEKKPIKKKTRVSKETKLEEPETITENGFDEGFEKIPDVSDIEMIEL